MRGSVQALVLVLGLPLGGCLGPGSVARVVDGELVQGRPIATEAYAAYLRAALYDHAGDRERALQELARALDEDPRSPEILTRIGAVTCRSEPAGQTQQPHPRPKAAEVERALHAFSAALAEDPAYAPAFYGRALCLEASGDRRAALPDAERAAYLDPLRPECTELVARLLFAANRPQEAWIWIDGLRTLRPESLSAHTLALAAARKYHPARVPAAERSVAAVAARSAADPAASLALALATKDLRSARRVALELHLSGGALALAAVSTAPELAVEQAERVLAADPTDSDAWIAGLAAADRLGDEARFLTLLAVLDPDPLPPSPAALPLLAELLARHVGSASKELLERVLGSGPGP